MKHNPVVEHGGKLIVAGAVSGGLIPIFAALLLTTPLYPALALITAVLSGLLLAASAIWAVKRWG